MFVAVVAAVDLGAQQVEQLTSMLSDVEHRLSKLLGYVDLLRSYGESVGEFASALMIAIHALARAKRDLLAVQILARATELEVQQNVAGWQQKLRN